jgi:hypothetical protein
LHWIHIFTNRCDGFVCALVIANAQAAVAAHKPAAVEVVAAAVAAVEKAVAEVVAEVAPAAVQRQRLALARETMTSNIGGRIRLHG